MTSCQRSKPRFLFALLIGMPAAVFHVGSHADEPTSCSADVEMGYFWAGANGARTARQVYDISLKYYNNPPPLTRYSNLEPYDPDFEVYGSVLAYWTIEHYDTINQVWWTDTWNIAGNRYDRVLTCPENYAPKAYSNFMCAPTIANGQVCPDPGAVPGEPAPCNGVGNPIDRATRNKYQKEEDFRGVEVFPLEIVRHYNSDWATFNLRRNVYNWGFAFGGIRVTDQPQINNVNNSGHAIEGFVTVDRPDGKLLKFKNLNGVWVAKNGSNDQLEERLSSGARVGWYFTTGDRIETFDANGRLESIVNNSGVGHFYTYNSNGQISAVTHSFGRALQMLYASQFDWFPNQVNHSAGSSYYYGSNMSYVQFPDGSRRTYVYDEPANAPTEGYLLTGIIDENNVRYSTYKYNNAGKGVSTEYAGGVNKHVLSNVSGGTRVTDALGTARTYSFKTIAGKVLRGAVNQPAGAGCSASISNLIYNEKGAVDSREDFNGVKQCFINDANRALETVRVEGVSNATACSSITPVNASLPAGTRKISTEWHPDWQLPARTSKPGQITTFIYNGQPDPLNGGAIASCAPSTALLPGGRPIAVLCKRVEQATTDTDGGLGFSAPLQSGISNHEEKWTYNQYGQVLTHDGPRTDVNDISTYAYYTDTTTDHTVGDLQSFTNAAGQATQYTHYNQHGQLLQSVDANGINTVQTYDARQRLLTSTVDGKITTYAYDLAGQLKRVTLFDGSFVGYDYDNAHRLVAVYDNKDNRIEYVLDKIGNQIAENTKDPSGTLKRQLSRSVDALGRVQQTTGRE